MGRKLYCRGRDNSEERNETYDFNVHNKWDLKGPIILSWKPQYTKKNQLDNDV